MKKYDFLNDYSDNFFEARKKLLHNDPFYAHMVGQMCVEMDKSVKTISVKEKDGIISLLYCQEWVDSLETDQVVEAIKHVVNHLIFGHLNNPVFDDKNQKMETAKDLAINTGLNQKNLPPQFKKPKDYQFKEDLATFQYYNMLPDEEEKDNENGQDGQDGRDGCDNHDLMTSSVGDGQLQQQVKQMVQHAYDESNKNFSPTGSGFSKLLRFLLSPSEIPWNVIFRQFVSFSSKVKREQTWKRPNRRFGEDYQGRKKVQTLRIMVAVDESGSVSDKEWKKMISEVDSMYKTKIAEIVFIKFTCTIEDMFEYKGLNNLVFKRHNGGTSFQPVMDKAMEEKPDALIILTDGYNSEGDNLTYDRWGSVLWVLTPNHREIKRGKSVVMKDITESETMYW